jgi:N-acetylglucosaminyldiphosphoundecaprenol N-acetyl-beta-D-mannosaminyltransferase
VRASLLGCPVDILSLDETLDLAREAIVSRKRLQHVALNVAKLVNMRNDPILAADVVNSDVVGVVGMGIVWAAKCMGITIKARVAGIDLLNAILALCARDGFKPYFLGATPEILDQAVRRTTERHPLIRFAGAQHGYFAESHEIKIVDRIRQSAADCLFIGMPSPRKERFLSAHRDEVNVPFIMGVGGSFDVLAGKVKRAPVHMQQVGLEWLYRVYQEPRRMWWRYARTNTLFAGILAQAVIRRGVYLAINGRAGTVTNATPFR